MTRHLGSFFFYYTYQALFLTSTQSNALTPNPRSISVGHLGKIIVKSTGCEYRLVVVLIHT